MQTVFNTLTHSVIFNTKGESTQALVLDQNSYVVGFGVVTRHPEDQPDRIMGQKWALVKALENSKLDRLERTEIWKKFHGH